MIAVPDGHKEFLVRPRRRRPDLLVHRHGRPADSWGLTAPRATLCDRKGRLIGTHFAGPTWKAKDGSSVVGRRVDGVTVDPTAIPWLILEAASTTAGAEGIALTETTSSSAPPPSVGSPRPSALHPSHRWSTAEVPYTADYHFWKAQPGCGR